MMASLNIFKWLKVDIPAFSHFYVIGNSSQASFSLCAKKIILLRKLLARGKVYVARSDRKSRRVLGAHLVLIIVLFA